MKLTESNVPEYLRVVVVYLHQGNTSNAALKRVGRTKARYVTIARLFDGNNTVGRGVAACSQRDRPSRQVGRAVAIGRALADYGAR